MPKSSLESTSKRHREGLNILLSVYNQISKGEKWTQVTNIFMYWI